jgi:phage terminase large subunit-like protein
LDDQGVEVTKVAFDRWRIDIFKKAAEDCGAFSFAEWLSIGQGYKDMSPRLEAFEALLLAGKIRHGGHPLLNMAAANAIAVQDPAGAKKLDKSKASLRIDPLVAAVMAVFEVSESDSAGGGFDVGAMIA